MNSQLLDIQPRELKFIFEIKKQSSCSVRLINNTHSHVAFKVKTTSPKKYCVRPNVGVIMPNSSCDFTVTMQAPRSAPPDMECKDKFLIQSTVVPAGTTDEDVTARIFSKDGGKYVEENKLRVILVSPPDSLALSPIHQTLQQGSGYEDLIPKAQVLSRVEILNPEHKVAEEVNKSKMINDEVPKINNDKELKPGKDAELKPVAHDKEFMTYVSEEVNKSKVNNGEVPKINNDKELLKPGKDAELKPAVDVELKKVRNEEEQKLVKDIEELKSKLNKLESKLSEAEVTILKLTEERGISIQERKILKEELAVLRSRKGIKRVPAGFPFLFVCVVWFVSMVLGYLLHR